MVDLGKMENLLLGLGHFVFDRERQIEQDRITKTSLETAHRSADGTRYQVLSPMETQLKPSRVRGSRAVLEPYRTFQTFRL